MNHFERRFVSRFLPIGMIALTIVAIVAGMRSFGHGNGHPLKAQQKHVIVLSPQHKAMQLGTKFDLELSELQRLVLAETPASEAKLEEIMSRASHIQMIDCLFFLTGLVDEENYFKFRHPIKIAMIKCEEAALNTRDLGDRISLFEIVDHAANIMNEYDLQPPLNELGSKTVDVQATRG